MIMLMTSQSTPRLWNGRRVRVATDASEKVQGDEARHTGARNQAEEALSTAASDQLKARLSYLKGTCRITLLRVAPSSWE